jgi:ribosomal protein L36
MRMILRAMNLASDYGLGMREHSIRLTLALLTIPRASKVRSAPHAILNTLHRRSLPMAMHSSTARGTLRKARDKDCRVIRRKGRVCVETGTGITMSAGCNMTQWFAWLIMILTGAMNQKGGAWFHPPA